MQKPEKPKRIARLKRSSNDSVFTCLFRQPESLRALCQSLRPQGADVKDGEIELITLENALTNKLYTGISFEVRDRLIVLVDAQTVIGNLGSKMLFAIGDAYQTLVDKRKWDVYSTVPLQIPRPALFALYTGSDENTPDKMSFADFCTNPNGCSIEMVFKILRFQGKMDIIDQYIRFCRISVEKETQYGQTRETIDAVFQACAVEGVLSSFLQSQAREVRDIMMAQFQRNAIQLLDNDAVR